MQNLRKSSRWHGSIEMECLIKSVGELIDPEKRLFVKGSLQILIFTARKMSKISKKKTDISSVFYSVFKMNVVGTPTRVGDRDIVTT